MTAQQDHSPSTQPPERQNGADSASLPSARAPAGRHSGRNRLLGGLGLFFFTIGAVWLGYWFVFLRLEESTNDAYAAGNLVRVSPQVTGSVEAILVDNNDAVAAGQVLLRLDDADAVLTLRRARAALADAVRQTGSLMAESQRLRSMAALRKSELDKAQGDFERRRDQKTAMAVSEEELRHSRDNLAIARMALQVAEDDMRRNYLLLQDTPLAEQPLVRQHAHQMREAWLALKRCEIKSPVAGFVARRTVQVGMHVTPGAPLMAVVPLREVWVDANFKEVQLARMRIGQPATVEADIYGNSVLYRGVVAGFSAGTGSSFSLLPPENATGNWIKVVQRVPVKVVLNPEDLRKAPLLVGLSCTVRVDVTNADGGMLAAAPGADAPVLTTDALTYDLAEVDREIDEIIVEHAALKE